MSNVVLPVPPTILRTTVVPVRSDNFARTPALAAPLATPSDGLSDWVGGDLRVFESGRASAGFVSIFADNFTRADGAVGNGWTATGFAISGDAAVSSGAADLTQAFAVSGAPSNTVLMVHLHLKNTGAGTTKVSYPNGDYCIVGADGSLASHLGNGTLVSSGDALTGDVATGVDLLFLLEGSGAQVYEGLLPTAANLRANHAMDESLATLSSPYSFTVEASAIGQSVTYFELLRGLLATTDRLFTVSGAPATAVQIDYSFEYDASLILYIGDVASINPMGAVGAAVGISQQYVGSAAPTWAASAPIPVQSGSGTLRVAVEHGNLNTYLSGSLISSIAGCPFETFDQVGVNLNNASNYGFTPSTCYVSNFRMDGLDTAIDDIFEDVF